MLTIFIAAASSEYVRARYWADAVRSHSGLHLVSTWHETAHQWNGKDHECSLDEQVAAALKNERELAQSALFWLLMPVVPSVGAFVELGQALLHPKLVVVSGANAESSIYTARATALPGTNERARHAKDDEGFSSVLRFARHLAGGVP